MRKRATAAFKADIVGQAWRGERTTAELAAAYDLDPIMINRWKREAPQSFTHRRQTTPAFRAAIVAEVLRGERTTRQIAAEHGIQATLISQWKHNVPEAVAVAASKPASVADGIGTRIGMLRHQCGMTQQVLSAALGVSRSRLAQWEMGRGGEIRHLSRIADVLGVPIEVFLNGMTSQPLAETVDIDEAEMLQLYRVCSVTDRLRTLRYIESFSPEDAGLPGRGQDASAETERQAGQGRHASAVLPLHHPAGPGGEAR